ncbi:MAG: hypothetical protein FJW34_18965, partial [Acidobacteria bacterium]|nr:hypothetical protein [Acidobacteriota bacterium]
MWVLPVAGGPLQKLQEDAWGAALSPDGSRIAFRRSSGTEIRLVNAQGGEPRRLVSAPPGYSFEEALAWSPDGRRIAYLKRSEWGDHFAIESHDLNTGRSSTILSEPSLRGFCWARDGRIIYARLEAPPVETSSNLWEIQTHPRTAQARGRPRRLTHWAGFQLAHLGISADGRRLAFTRNRSQSDVYLGELESRGARLSAPQRLTSDERVDWPAGWTRDGQAVLFYSDRSGEVDIFRQGVTARQAQAVVTGPEEKRDARESPDGRWILYLAWPKADGQVRTGEGRLKRIPVSGGQPEVVFSVAGYPGPARVPGDRRFTLGAAGHPRFRCPSVPQAPCVLSELVQRQVVFTAFDPVAGRKRELARIGIDPSTYTFWDLSPDGRWIAFGTREEESGRIRLLSLAGQAPREISAGGWTHLEFAAWAPDGKALFVTGWASNGPPLLRVPLDGETRL